MAIRTIGQVISDAITFIQSKIPSLSLLTGTVARDVVVESPAQEFALNWNELDRVQRQQTLTDASAYTDEELTLLASSLGLTRSPGVTATGSVTFRVANFTAGSNDIVIPIGTAVSTSGGLSNNNVVSFNTTVEKTFSAINANTYLNVATGFYELDVPVQAANPGVEGNVGAGAITTLINTISGVNSIVNILPTSGGSDEETNESLLARIQTKLMGTAAGTTNGILSLINSNTSVTSSLLIRPGDEELVRDQYGNAADVLIIGETLSSFPEVRNFSPGVVEYILTQQPLTTSTDPVESIITGVSNGNSFDFIRDVHFKVVLDNTSLTRGSTRAQAKIVFLGSPFPDASTPFTVNYTINSLVGELQSTLDADSNKIIGTDILVREAVKVLVRVSAFITIYPGYTKTDVVTTATDNVANYLNSSTLNQSVDESDIIAVIANTPGVDSVSVPITLEVKRPTDLAFYTTSSIAVARTEYVRPDSTAGAISIT